MRSILGKVDDITAEDKTSSENSRRFQALTESLDAPYPAIQKGAQPPITTHIPTIKGHFSGIGVAFSLPLVCGDTRIRLRVHLNNAYLYFPRPTRGSSDQIIV